MQTSEIRKRFIDYFKSKGHLELPSHSLISPDPSTLFTIAGMVPLIPFFTGLQKPPSDKIVSVQKCVRTLDIDEVGKTTRHGTFFQMNGNFAINSYFKKEAIEYAWELVTGDQKDGFYGIDKEKIWVTIHKNDDEAFQIWSKILPVERIQKRGDKDNFWHTGAPGPGGECSEIYVDRGEAHGKEGGPIADEDRYIEIWNLVFQHYIIDNVKSKEDFNIVGQLPSKNIDTGAGLERIATYLQGKDNMYEIDEVFPVIEKMSELSNKKYRENKKDDILFRVIADHIRSSVMIIGDGVKPSNEGRGYVLRRLLRRSIRSAKLLGYDKPIIKDLFTVSTNVMGKSYPELIQDFQRILNIGLNEEESFRKTLKSGINYFNTALSKLDNNKTLDGKTIFELHDTHGFPFEITKEMANEKGLDIDQDKFLELMKEQKDRARKDAREKRGLDFDNTKYNDILKNLEKPNKFIGYDNLTMERKVMGILSNNISVPNISSTNAQNSIEIILNDSPFYFESGGQQADKGTITTDLGAILEVIDVQAPIKGLIVHKCNLKRGEIRVQDKVVCNVDKKRRDDIRKAHSSTHMIHKALREILGEESTQAGSLDAPNRLRFDIHNGEKITDEQIRETEYKVNEMLLQDLEVDDKWMDIDEAKKQGAMALFGEKYSNDVRVVSIGGDWSKELCVGTHVNRTGEIGSISIISESSIGSGIRRVEALTGIESFNYNNKEKVLISELSNIINTPKDNLITKIESIVDQLSNAQKKLQILQKDSLFSKKDEFIKKGKTINNTKVVFAVLEGIEDQTLVRDFGSSIMQAIKDEAIVIIFSKLQQKSITTILTNDKGIQKGIKANDIPKILQPIVEGGGGGKPNFATVGGKKSDNETVKKIELAIENYVKNI